MTLNFKIAEEPLSSQTHRIVDLCDYLTAKVLEPMFKRAGWRWERRFMNFFSFDNTCQPLEPTGTLRLTIPPLLAGQVTEMEARIKDEFKKLRITTDPFTYQRDPRTGAIQGFEITVLENPTVLAAPPEVNISYTRGCVVLRDLLGYKLVNGRYEFEADDLLKRVSSVTEDKIAACSSSPVWDPKKDKTVKRTPSQVSMKAVARCLSEIRFFAQWAQSHNHRKLAAI